jgi:predicted amidohydrolase YtcJ
MVILDGDPAAIDPEKIKDIRVQKTLVGGDVKYQA